MNLQTDKNRHPTGLSKFCIFILSMTFLILSSFPVSADSIGSGSADIFIKVNSEYSENYRYSADVIYYSMVFRFDMHSIAVNSETGEKSVNSGEWLMEDNKTDSVTITVVNHADTPIRANALVDESDFSRCGTKVEKVWADGNVIPACEINGENTIIWEKTLLIKLNGYPTPETFEGEKRLFITAEIVPASGYTSAGEYYESRFR